MPKILVVEDNEILACTLESFLASEHHVVDTVATGNEGLERALYYSYDVIILDWDLPQLSGIEICCQYRARGGKAPVLILTGKSLTREKAIGLDSGADDYLTKPFAMPELAARIRALLRRAPVFSPSKLSTGNLTIDTASGRVIRDGTEIHLLPKEFALLEFFMRHPNQTFTAKVLIAKVWSTDSEMSTEAIRPYINRLRAKTDSPGGESLIKTIRGRGYMLTDGDVIASGDDQK